MKHNFFTSHLSPFTFTLLAAVLMFAACEQDAMDDIEPHSIEYAVFRHDIPNTTTTVKIKNDKDLDILFDSICDYTMQGKFVTFHGNKKTDRSSKETSTYSTSSREEMKAWMRRMEDEGKTVTVTYNSETRMWEGMAYINVTQGTESAHRRLERATMNYVYVPGVYEEYVVFTYFWDGDRLTNVDMVTERYNRYYDGTDTIFYTHNTATLTYNDSLRTAAHFYNANGETIDQIQYTYQNGLLVRETQNSHTYTYNYNNEGLIESWGITPSHNIALPSGLHCEWENGDMVRAYFLSNLYESFEYDNSPHPYAVSLGTTTLLPGHQLPPDYHGYIMQHTQWSRHNLVHFLENTNTKSHITEMHISYTYDSDGYPVTAETNRIDNETIHWTFEYVEQ